MGVYRGGLAGLPWWTPVAVLLIMALWPVIAHSQGKYSTVDAFDALWRWMPFLVWSGFLFNVLISVLAMAIGTTAGIALGLAQISPSRPLRATAWFITQLFRNSPWLVILFIVLLAFPFEVQAFGMIIRIPDWVKGVFGLSLPVMANISEVVRGAVQSVPTAQWEGVSLDVMKGEVICIICPSGSGKSTLIRCINALNDIQGGSITVEGQEVDDANLDKLELRKKVGMVFQQYNLFPHKTALENVMMAPLKVLKQDQDEVRERARRLMAKVRLQDKEDSYPGELSGGQQQRVAIARSLAMNPDVMLFDEVTAALDPETVKEVLVTIRELAEEGMTCILVTHEMGFAREVADHIYFTDRGVIVEHGPPATFFTQASDPRTREFLSQIL